MNTLTQKNETGFALSLVKPVTIEQKNKEDGTRSYVIGDNEYNSVTTALSVLTKKKISTWKKAVGESYANEHSNRQASHGQRIHDACEKYVLGESVNLMPTDIGIFKQFKKFLDDNVYCVYGVELPLYSDELRAAGTCDLVCNCGGYNTILDYKISGRHKSYDDCIIHFIQAGTYAIMFEELYNMPIHFATILTGTHGGFKPFIEEIDTWKNRARDFWKHYHNGDLS